ncbi:MAG: hypothetical protein RIR11_1460 [Bacteroidota bacterium]|jgi:hypothetical protein
MLLIKANLDFNDAKRKNPIQGDTYRPLLFFGTIIRSGLIVLDGNECLEMGKSYENRLIKIYFYKDLDVEKEFFVGRSFIMSEGGFETGFIGKGVITEIIGIEKI